MAVFAVTVTQVICGCSFPKESKFKKKGNSGDKCFLLRMWHSVSHPCQKFCSVYDVSMNLRKWMTTYFQVQWAAIS